MGILPATVSKSTRQTVTMAQPGLFEIADAPLLVVVDMQNGFVNQNSQHVVAAVVRLVEAWKTTNLPLILTRFVHKPGSAFERHFGWSAMQTQPDIDLIPELHHLNDLVMTKSGYTCFTPQLQKLGRFDEARAIVFCGIATDSCVLKSAADAFELGHRPIVVNDACASDAGSAVHESGLLVLRRLIGRDQITTLDEVLETLSVSLVAELGDV